MAFKSVALPLSGGLVVLGYAAFAWLRTKHGRARSSEPSASPSANEVERLSSRLEHVPAELALDLDSEALPANNNAAPRAAAVGALFLGRANTALSPFSFGPDWPTGAR